MNMKAESENFTARESIDLIAAMIQEAKGNVQRNHFYFLLWGWVVVLANLGMYALTGLDYDRPYAVWLITIPAWIFTLYKVFSSKKAMRTTTHFDRISGWLWMSFGITIFSLVFFGHKIGYQLNPVILNFRPLMLGGTAFWVAGVACFLVPMGIQPLVGAVGVVCGYLIPGYMLKQKKG